MKKRLLTLALPVLALLVVPQGTARAVSCDIPMIAQQVAVPPNVMILVDNSGSMNEVMWHEDYDPGTIYSGNFTWDRIYYVGSDGMRTPRSFSYYWPSSPSAYLVDGLHGSDGRYIGNYLNWVFFHASDDQRDHIPRMTRQVVANTAVKQVVNAASGLRYGIARFNYDSGAVIEARCGAATSTLEYEIDVMSANSWTPSGEALWTLAQHFEDASNGPIEYTCQKNFIIFVTDGLPTKDKSVPSVVGDQDGDNNEPGSCASIGAPQYSESNDCSDYMDDVAYYMANNDMRPDLSGEQNVVTYTIGFGVDAPLLADTAANGQGLYRLAWNLETLIAELGTVVGDIVNRISSGAAVAVVSTETGTDDRLYRGKFLPGDWRGYLEAFSLPYSNGDSPVWEAGTRLAGTSANSRDLFTWFDGDKVEFDQSNLEDLAQFIAPDGPGSGLDFEDGYGVDFTFDDDFVEDYDGSEIFGPNFDEDYASDIVDWVRGVDIGGLRDRRGWKLGDLVYSTPVVVGAPAGFHSELDFHEWARDLEGRKPVVYVGANDGMLHAFKASTGDELWAFLPQATLPKLEFLADPSYCHTAMVDLSPKAFDVNLNGRWRTVLVGGQRTGGDSYFALDVTDPDAPEVLWETRIPNMISSFTEAVLVDTKNGPVIWAGSGPDTGGDARVSVIDLATGDVLHNQVLSSGVPNNMATAPSPFDHDFDGVHDVVYQADLSGRVYRFVLGGDTDPVDWYETIYTGNEPISTRPAIAIDENLEPLLVFGTGQFLEAADFTDTTPQRFVCFRDPGYGAHVASGDLVNRTGDLDEDVPEDGWYVWLENGGGERVTEPAVALEGVVYFTSYRPSTSPCSSGGDSWLYRIELDNGNPVDSDDDDEIDDENRSESLGSGVASRPVVNLAGEQLIVQTSDARLNVEELSIAPQKVMIRAWRERYDNLSQTVEEDPQGGGTN